MSGSSRSRPKPRLEPISLDELAGTTGMSGFGTLFTRDLSQPVPVLDHLDSVRSKGSNAPEANSLPRQSSALESGALVSGIGALTSSALVLKRSALESPSGGPSSDAVSVNPISKESSAPVLTALISGALESSDSLNDVRKERLAQAESSALDSGAVDPSALESGALNSSAPDPEIGALGSTPDELDAATHTVSGQSSALDSSALDASVRSWETQNRPGYRRPKIRLASTVQDGHSLAEQAVYDAMFKAGKPYQGESRILTTGLRTLAEKARMAYANCKANVHSLINKLAVEDYGGGFSYTTGRTYIIYSFGEILKRRRVAGLTHVIRTRGVAFVDPKTGIRPDVQITCSGALDTGALDLMTSALVPGAPAYRDFRKEQEQQHSAVDPAIVKELGKYGPISDAAAADLVDLCKAVCPELTTEEITLMIDQKMASTKVPSNAIGLLRIALPLCFQGDSFLQFRHDLAQMHDAERRARATQQRLDEEAAERILQSNGPDQDMREWAQEVLAKRHRRSR